jgi:hypothetical protein
MDDAQDGTEYTSVYVGSKDAEMNVFPPCVRLALSVQMADAACQRIGAKL